MKNNDSKKITALGVVIFSFVGILIFLACVVLIDVVAALIVAKTAISEGFLKIGSIIASGAGLIVSTAYLTLKSGIKGVFAAAIISMSVLLIKIVGNGLLNLHGYFDLNGFVGMLIVLVFSLVGGVIGGMQKR